MTNGILMSNLHGWKLNYKPVIQALPVTWHAPLVSILELLLFGIYDKGIPFYLGNGIYVCCIYIRWRIWSLIIISTKNFVILVIFCMREVEENPIRESREQSQWPHPFPIKLTCYASSDVEKTWSCLREAIYKQ